MSLNLILAYEPSALAAPQSFRDAMQTAANILQATIKDNITVTLQVGYGDWYNGLITGLGTSAVGGDLYGSYVSYTSLKAALASRVTSTLDQTFLNSLPNGTSVNGMSGFYVPSTIEKVLGMISPTASVIDGAVGFGTQISTANLVGVALHEFTHAMGREPGAGTFDLGRYTSPGNHLFSSGNTAPPSYFSIDGGVTKLADYGQNSDPADMLNSGIQGPNDPFNEYYSGSTIQNLTLMDIQNLDSLGFNVGAIAPGAPSAATSSIVASSPTVTADGTSTTTLTVTVKDANGNAVSGTAVTLSGSGSSNSFGAISGTTNAGGVFTTTLASTLAQTETITATVGNVQEQTSVNFVAGAPSAATSSIVASSPTVTADGVSATTLTVTVKDAHGNAVGGTAVTLSASGSSNSFGALSGTTDAHGVFTTTLASTLAQNENITATVGSVQEHAFVSFVPMAIQSNPTQVGNNVYLDGGSGPELKFGGAAYVAGQWGAWTPYAAVKTATGYDVAWKADANHYTVWSADSNGNWIQDLINNASGSSTAFQSIETTFKQDLNGDGVIGVPTTAITTSTTATTLTQVGNNVYLDGGSGPELKFGGAAYVAGQWGAWTPYAAVNTATGYDVAWKADANHYTVWSADSKGNWIQDLINTASGSSTAFQSIETTFKQDLNGDGVIGVPTTATTSTTTVTTLTQLGNNVYLDGGSGPELKFGGAAYVAGQWGAWTPYAAVKTATGYEVAWKADANHYTVWSADSNGNWISDIILNVSGSSSALESIETTFKQDLNGDGVIGVPVAAIHLASNGPTIVTAAMVQDSFVFLPNFGQVTLASSSLATTNIQVSSAVFANTEQLLAAATDDGRGNVVITDATHDTLTIQNMTLQDLHAHQNDFHII
jgi:20S proteasome alpha/beta subunit